MRNANELPLQRIPLKELLTLPSADPTTPSLVKDLSAIRQKIGILPGELKVCVISHSGLSWSTGITT